MTKVFSMVEDLRSENLSEKAKKVLNEGEMNSLDERLKNIVYKIDHEFVNLHDQLLNETL